MLYTDGLIERPGLDIDVGIDRLLGEADRLVVRGFAGGAANLMQQTATTRPATDRPRPVLIWRSLTCGQPLVDPGHGVLDERDEHVPA